MFSERRPRLRRLGDFSEHRFDETTPYVRSAFFVRVRGACYVRTLALERLLAHAARAGEAMGRPGAIPRSDGHITTRGEVLGSARPSPKLFSKGARND